MERPQDIVASEPTDLHLLSNNSLCLQRTSPWSRGNSHSQSTSNQSKANTRCIHHDGRIKFAHGFVVCHQEGHEAKYITHTTAHSTYQVTDIAHRQSNDQQYNGSTTFGQNGNTVLLCGCVMHLFPSRKRAYAQYTSLSN